ncbi:hypothetical protein XI25_09830 [Paenibacillus sp. DMB20]|nr:hypothetical protein XI25_09830 [Paenibacillus sp. DMB20]
MKMQKKSRHNKENNGKGMPSAKLPTKQHGTKKISAPRKNEVNLSVRFICIFCMFFRTEIVVKLYK